MAQRHRTFRGRRAIVEFTFDDSAFDGLLEAADAVARAFVREKAEDWGRDVTAYMKANAPWDNQTGNARGSLGMVPEYEHIYVLSLTAGVFYMRFLEQRQAGKWAILKPAMDAFASVLERAAGLDRERG
jgi:hypothetical protein